MLGRDCARILEILGIGVKDAAARKTILEIIEALSPEDFATTMRELGANVDIKTLGHFLFPLIMDRLCRDRDAFSHMLSSIGLSNSSAAYIITALEYLERAAVSHSSDSRVAFGKALGTLVRTASAPVEARAEAVKRTITLSIGEAEEIIEVALSGNEPEILSAGGAVACAWVRGKGTLPAAVERATIKAATVLDTRIAQAPGLIRALAAIKSTDAIKVLEAAWKADLPDADRETFTRAAGTMATDRLLGMMARYACLSQEPAILRSICGALLERRAGMLNLWRAGFERETLQIAKAWPHLLDIEDLRGFAKILAKKNSSQARALQKACHYHNILESYGIINILRSADITPSYTPPPPRVQQVGYSTGLLHGDAIYKNLSSATDFLGNHWHSGLYGGFNGSSLHSFCLFFVHVNDLTYAVSRVERSTTGLRARSANLSNELSVLHQGLISDFAGSDGFTGARTAPGLDYATRERIVDTALSARAHDISYAFWDMLNWWWGGWDGTVDDIRTLRCDGLVEYSYEKHGVRVCGGEDPTEWNIATPGKNHPDNHNIFHGNGCTPGDYSLGELCPRIQAGDIGADTSFASHPPVKPDIADFAVNPFSPTCVYLFFSIISFDSTCVWIRIEVGPAGGNDFYFLKSFDPFGLGEHGGGFIADTWGLRKSDHHRWWQGFGLCWDGSTVQTLERIQLLGHGHSRRIAEAAGPVYRGLPGNYAFKVQCIDRGGNVSDELICERNLTWT